MSLIRKLAALGVAAEAARRYAQRNPEQVRRLTDKAASFADQRTKGRYSGQIESVKRVLADLGGYAAPATPSGQERPVSGQAEVTSIRPGSTTAAHPTPHKRA
jgi:hypothetical protein